MKVHLAIAVRDIASSVAEYSQLLGAEPVLVIPDAYALWRTEILNFSIRQTPSQHGAVRHVGFEDPNTERFSETTDSNGLVWERFTAAQQAAEATTPDLRRVGTPVQVPAPSPTRRRHQAALARDGLHRSLT